MRQTDHYGFIDGLKSRMMVPFDRSVLFSCENARRHSIFNDGLRMPAAIPEDWIGRQDSHSGQRFSICNILLRT
jgi:hypothetical protein